MVFTNTLSRRKDLLSDPPIPFVANEITSDDELGLKFRVAIMLQRITHHVIGEYENGVVALAEHESIDEYYAHAQRLGQFAADLLDMKQDPDYMFKPTPTLRFTESEPPL